jgi:hypothetical protein
LNIDVINKVCNHLSSIDSVNFLRAINLYGKYYEEQIDRLIVDYKYSIQQHEKATQCSECDDIILCYSCKTGSQNMCEFCNKFLCADCSLFTSDELCISDIFMGNKVCLECLIEYAKKNNRVCAGCNAPFFNMKVMYVLEHVLVVNIVFATIADLIIFTRSCVIVIVIVNVKKLYVLNVH